MLLSLIAVIVFIVQGWILHHHALKRVCSDCK